MLRCVCPFCCCRTCIPVRAEDKAAALLWLVREGLPQGSSTLVFASTRHHVEFLHNLMGHEGVPAACVFGSMDQVSVVVCCLCVGVFVDCQGTTFFHLAAALLVSASRGVVLVWCAVQRCSPPVKETPHHTTIIT